MKLDALPIQVWLIIVVAPLLIVYILSRPRRGPFVPPSYDPNVQRHFASGYDPSSQHYLAPRSQGGLGGVLLTILVLVLLIGAILYLKNPHLLQQANPSSLPLPSLSVAQAAVAAPGQLRGGPSLSASFVEKVLQVNNSPAQGQGLGTTLYQLSQQDNIDDAVPLGQFDHESGFGKFGVARVTHSLGNIKCSPGYSCYAGYRAYASWAGGAKDWFDLMKTVYLPRGLDTVEKVIPVYAPGGGEQAYIDDVLADIKRWRAGEV